MPRRQKSAFDTTAPKRLLEIGGDIHATLHNLRAQYERKYKETYNTFYATAAVNVGALIPNRYQEALEQ